ncbi:cell division protein FtsQ/DivIB [Rathayibacter iranicus]|uniref:Cell division protein FtsQ n=2 Tax=Rathayibacter iranicus TaxID=59737 RepID=A0AAD2JG14_9MICO|nr:cell division protein FtsQ/DivIB [Rathayibacter iranicus]AZZ54858.1 cell division protein FtsQ [Rathayibacter iranicus]MWV31431.1 FtsQ-type POTRA domain-containing protein [Rathayibacter iranicus NCPPB 2253 = VKM Ac-1602]PPI50342.1 cell division protein FtsQ [Rathayibacter iranicus]PPI62777.1 cell division protein FtsQ [Rathayibacter iranicus]PPI73670.1 cell division protein FtsQ [Rathayibacter iranicus]
MKRPDGTRPAAASRMPTSPVGGDGEQTREYLTEPIRVSSRPARSEGVGALISAVAAVRLPGAENRVLRRAARERRRFERGEVRRFTKRARRRRLIALVVAGSLVALAAVVGIAAYSPLMAVRSIEISGTQRVDAAALQSALSDQLGVPLTLVDRGDVGRVLGASSLIQSYSVQTRPPGTLVIAVVERTPIGVLAKDGRFDLVDAAGVVIESADAAQAGYPVLSTPSGDASGVGFRATARVLRTLPVSLAGQVTEATATTGDDVSLTLANGARIVWGGSNESALKAVVLEKLMATTDPATIASYDVSSPEAAVVAPRP